MYERKKDLINNSKLTDSQKLKLMNEIDNFSADKLQQLISEIEKNKEELNDDKKTTVILASILIIIIILIILIIANENNVKNNLSPIDNNEAIIKEEKDSKDIEKVETPVLTEAQKKVLEVAKLIEDSDLAFDTGSYIAGDIPVGEYAFIRLGDGGQYYCEKDMAGNIVDNENFDSFGYVKVHGVGNLTTHGVLGSVKAFEKIGVASAKELEEKINSIENYNQGGYYKVGVDILAGTYVIESIGENGYYSKNTGPIGDSKIIDNDNFDGKVSVNLSNGQYIDVSRAIITNQ